MWKEMIICALIVIVIVLGDITTKNYMMQSIGNLNKQLEILKKDIYMAENKEIDKQETENYMNQINESWSNAYEKMAYFIEHDELEKVETEFTSLSSLIESEEYEEARNELDKSIYILRHIEDKYKFNLQNVF